MMDNFKILSSSTIKIIAITAMLIDHTGAVFDLHIGFRVVGRLAFPLFVYLIAEGFRHTKSMEKYLLRLGIFALISEIPFDLAFNNNIDFLNNTNIFYTLWLGAACAYIFRQIQHIPFFWVMITFPVVAAMTAAGWLGSDYRWFGVLFVFFAIVVAENKFLLFGVITLFMLQLYFPSGTMLVAALMAVPIAALANGKRGWPAKWLFYWFYPVHLLILAGIRQMFLIFS